VVGALVKNCHPILLLYPDDISSIKRLLVSETNFAEICDDYCLIVDEIRKYEETNNNKSDPTFSELNRLRADLECEIKNWLTGGR